MADLTQKLARSSKLTTPFTTVAIGGFESNSGKTTLMCRLLSTFSGWEAIKLTKGHFRSCGKDPHACCVSHLLGDAPLVHSGRQGTYTLGKDTGRYWDAGATNVHWVISTDKQVEEGIALALERVKGPGVFIEGNSFLKFVDVDLAVIVSAGADRAIKPSARRVLSSFDAAYLDRTGASSEEIASLASQLNQQTQRESTIPVYTPSSFSQLVDRIKTASWRHKYASESHSA
jgi:hypothetical protein